VIILAPPDLPLPLLLMAILILNKLRPKGMPRVGFVSRSLMSLAMSDLKEGYFLINGFASLSKFAVILML
jgi:hypothetical protein